MSRIRTTKTTAPAGNQGAGDVDPGKPTQQEITIDEFCIRLSRQKRRVELIGAFHSREKRAGRLNDAEASYRDRFDKFTNLPV